MKAKLIKDSDGYWLDISDDNITKRPLTDFGQISIKNCDEIFGIVDVEKLAEEEYREFPTNPKDKPEFTYGRDTNCHRKRKAYLKGFNKAMELNDKLFTVEDMQKLMYATINLLEQDEGVPLKFFKEFIQSLQQPKEIEVEIEMDICGDKVYAVPEPKLDENGCLILKRI
jgi:hypothetical protein